MENLESYFGKKSFDGLSRSERTEIVELAAKKIFEEVQSYISRYNRIPSIGICARESCVDYCVVCLNTSLSKNKICADVSYFRDGDRKDLVFDLDQIVNSYFS